ncbi:beta-ketoacyl synthase N-terminal-like domain-containing protein [Nonomuraea sp. NPDC004297]
MSALRLPVKGWGVLSGAGEGIAPLVERVRAGGPVSEPQDVTAMYDESLPASHAHALPGFDIRDRLGRKGTGNYDRATGLAVVACGEALREAGDLAPLDRVGVTVGTTMGSFRSTSEFCRETLVHDRPYLVTPGRFPAAIMNCAAGQMAIRYGLRGVNATLAGGPVGFFGALRYAATVLRHGYVDMMVAGAVEELSPHRMWQGALSQVRRAGLVGEAAAFFVLAPREAGEAEIVGLASGFGAEGRAGDALAGCVRRALEMSGAARERVALVLTGEAGPSGDDEYEPAVSVLGHRPERLATTELLGECHAANGAVALAVLLAMRRNDAGLAGACALLTGRSPDGAVAAAVVRLGGGRA